MKIEVKNNVKRFAINNSIPPLINVVFLLILLTVIITLTLAGPVLHFLIINLLFLGIILPIIILLTFLLRLFIARELQVLVVELKGDRLTFILRQSKLTLKRSQIISITKPRTPLIGSMIPFLSKISIAPCVFIWYYPKRRKAYYNKRSFLNKYTFEIQVIGATPCIVIRHNVEKLKRVKPRTLILDENSFRLLEDWWEDVNLSKISQKSCTYRSSQSFK